MGEQHNLVFVLASTATLAVTSSAIAQYGQPGVGVGYTAPGYTAPGYMGPPNNATAGGSIGLTDPNAVAGECAKGFSEETCRRRENATDSGSIGLIDPNALVRECARGFSVETCVRRENAIGSGSVDLTDPSANAGECAKGFSEETCRRRGQKYNPTADFNSRWPSH